jgi:hypothetical protein
MVYSKKWLEHKASLCGSCTKTYAQQMKLLLIGGTQQSFANHVTSIILNKLNMEKPQHWEVVQRNLDGTIHNLNLNYSIHKKWWGIAKNIKCGLNSLTIISSIFCS